MFQRSRMGLLLITALLGAATGSSAIAQCPTPAWSPDFTFPGGPLAGTIRCSTIFDNGDGTGPHLYAGGNFTSIGGVRAINVAKWTGTTWQPLSPTASGLYMSASASNLGTVYGLAGYQGKLYAVGDFTQIGSAGMAPAARQVRYFAVFNGTDWEKVSRGINIDSSNNNKVNTTATAKLNALAVYNDGTGEKLFFTGNIKNVLSSTGSTVLITGMGKWDGTTMSAVAGGGGVNFALNVLDEDGSGPLPARLYASNGSGVQRWNSTTWTALTGGVAIGGVSAIADFDPDAAESQLGALYAAVGGSFTLNGPIDGSGGKFARWDGSAWSYVDVGLAASERVQALASNTVSGTPRLYVSASRGTQPVATNGSLFTYDGTSAQSLAPHAIDGPPNMLLDSALLGTPGVLGIKGFFGADGAVVGGFAVWNGSKFSPLFGKNGMSYSSALTNANGRVLPIVFDDDADGPHRSAMYLQTFSTFGPLPGGWVGKFDGREWATVGTSWPAPGASETILRGEVRVFDTLDGPKLYTCGQTSFVDGNGETHFSELITRLDGDTWNTVTAPEGTPRNATSGSWAVVDHDGTGPVIYHLNQADQSLRAGAGVYKLVGGAFVPVDGFPLASTPELPSGSALTMAVLGQDLYVAGSRPGNIYGLFKFDGTSWSSVGTGWNGAISTLLPITDSSGPALIASGAFTTVDGGTVTKIGRWDGTSWSTVGSASTMTTGNAAVVRLVDLGGGPQLVAGPFLNAVRSEAYLAVFNGTDWVPLNAGAGFSIDALPRNGFPKTEPNLDLAVFDDGGGTPAMYVVGTFINVDGVPSEGIARYGCAIPPPCIANFNGVGGVTVTDIFAFLSAWFAGNPSADANASGTVTVMDIFFFLSHWFAGC